MIIDDKLMKYVIFQRRTEQEVRQKCQKLAYTSEYTDEIIEYLTENDYLNDVLFVEKYIQNVMRLKASSIYEMKIGLLKKGVAEDKIEAYLSSHQEELIDFEYASAKQLARKKARQITEREQIKKFLLGKGYSYDSINSAIAELEG